MPTKYYLNKKYLYLILISTIYSVAYILSYRYFLNTYFEYMGYIIVDRPLKFWLLSIFISVLPVFLYRGCLAISSFISLFIYLVLYIPTILTFAFASKEQINIILFVQLVFMCGMSLFFYADRFIFKNQKIGFKQKLSTRFFLYITVIATLYILWIFRNNMNLVSFSDVYIQRSLTQEIGSGIVPRYIASWLATFLIPLCLSYGLFYRKYLYSIIGIIACIILYMSTAAKGTILLPFSFFFLYFILNKFGIDRIFSTLASVLSISIITLVILTKPDTLMFMISSVFMMRTISIGGISNVNYYDFFLTHPNTYFSHVGIINKITGYYPYGNISIGETIGFFLFDTDVNANANFWATDGIASFGIFGIIIISLIFFLFLILLNTVTKKYNRTFIILLFLGFIGTLLNTSLFSSLMSGGGIFIIISLFFLDKEQLNNL